MPNYGYDWEKMYPEGFTHWATRHLPKSFHNRMQVLSAFLNMSVEMIAVKAWEVGLEALETELKALAEANGVKNHQSG